MTAVTVVRQPEDKRKILNFQLEMFDNWGGNVPEGNSLRAGDSTFWGPFMENPSFSCKMYQ